MISWLFDWLIDVLLLLERGSAEIGILEENVYIEKDKPGSGCRIFCLAIHVVIGTTHTFNNY